MCRDSGGFRMLLVQGFVHLPSSSRPHAPDSTGMSLGCRLRQRSVAERFAVHNRLSLLSLAIAISACGPVGPIDNPADPWRPEPMAAPNAFVADLDAACRNSPLEVEDPFADMSVTAADVRGNSVGLLVYTSDAGAGAVCWSGAEGRSAELMTRWEADVGRGAGDLGPTGLCLRLGRGHRSPGAARDSAHAVAGQHGGDIASVVIEGTVRGRVEASTVGGWFVAWWPGEEVPWWPGEGARFRILGLNGDGQPVTDLIAARDANDEDPPCSPD